eukprot:452089-Pyramimonas_sp.AAC.1
MRPAKRGAFLKMRWSCCKYCRRLRTAPISSAQALISPRFLALICVWKSRRKQSVATAYRSPLPGHPWIIPDPTWKRNRSSPPKAVQHTTLS